MFLRNFNIQVYKALILEILASAVTETILETDETHKR
jgi:hypothetical protein